MKKKILVRVIVIMSLVLVAFVTVKFNSFIDSTNENDSHVYDSADINPQIFGYWHDSVEGFTGVVYMNGICFYEDMSFQRKEVYPREDSVVFDEKGNYEVVNETIKLTYESGTVESIEMVYEDGEIVGIRLPGLTEPDGGIWIKGSTGYEDWLY